MCIRSTILFSLPFFSFCHRILLLFLKEKMERKEELKWQMRRNKGKETSPPVLFQEQMFFPDFSFLSFGFIREGGERNQGNQGQRFYLCLSIYAKKSMGRIWQRVNFRSLFVSLPLFEFMEWNIELALRVSATFRSISVLSYLTLWHCLLVEQLINDIFFISYSTYIGWYFIKLSFLVLVVIQLVT